MALFSLIHLFTGHAIDRASGIKVMLAVGIWAASKRLAYFTSQSILHDHSNGADLVVSVTK